METTKVRDNHKFNEENLKQYIIKHLNQPQSENPLKVIQFNSGQSNPTFLVTYNNFQCVMRKKPPGKLLKGAHLVDREFKVQQALYKQNFPVPQPYAYCSDTSVIGTEFYLMEYMQGRIFRDLSLPGLSPKERKEIYNSMCEVLIKLHSFDPLKIGLENYGKPTDYYKRAITTWTRNYKASETTQIKEFDYLMENLPNNIPKENGKVSIIHGDFRLDNMVFHPVENRVIAVLDWELSTLGDPLGDLAYNLMWHYAPSNSLFGLGNLDHSYYGIPNVYTYKNQYIKGMNLQPIQDKDWFFYLAFSYFRLASIAQGVYKRSLQGNASSTFAKQYEKNAKLCAKLSYQLFQKSQNGDIKPLSPLYQNFSPLFKELYQKLLRFMDEYVYPNEKAFIEDIQTGSQRWKYVPKIIDELKEVAKSQGLWNLFMPKSHSGLSVEEYAPLCEILGRSPIAPLVTNCTAPDTGNMEVLHMYGNKQQQDQWLKPLLEGKIRSCFAMTEPKVASSDATNINTTIIQQGDNYVVNGRKWYISMAGHPDCKIAIVMGITPNKNKKRHQQHTQILVPMDTPGVRIIRPMEVFGDDDAPFGHMDIIFDNVVVPKENIILGEGRGFEISQGRLGPGRVHHCMRSIGVAERAFENMMDRLHRRKPFGKTLAQYDGIRKKIGKTRIEIDSMRLIVLNAARMIDQVGAKHAKNEIAMIKVVIPKTVCKILDRVIQIYGAAGVSQDTMLANAYTQIRTLRLADGPDSVHLDTIAKNEIYKVYPNL